MKKIFMATAVAATALFSACTNAGAPAELKSNIDSVSYGLGMVRSIPGQSLKQGLMQMGSDSAYIKEFLQGVADGLKAAENKKDMAYNVGVQQGMMLAAQDVKGLESALFATDSTKHLNSALILAGYRDAIESNNILKNAQGEAFSQQEIFMMIQQIVMAEDAKSKEIKFGEYKKQNEEFLANIAKNDSVKPLENGVYYKEIVAGKGEKLAAGEKMELQYEGRLIDGTVFDSSIKRGTNAQFAVGVGAVVPGFDAALKNMPLGSEWEVYMPADQAYGAQESGDIKPFSTLIFKIKAIAKVKEAKKEAKK